MKLISTKVKLSNHYLISYICAYINSWEDNDEINDVIKYFLEKVNDKSDLFFGTNDEYFLNKQRGRGIPIFFEDYSFITASHKFNLYKTNSDKFYENDQFIIKGNHKMVLIRPKWSSNFYFVKNLNFCE